MIATLIILLALCLWKIRFSHFHEDYCGKDPTTAIKGILAVIILLSHIRGYIALEPTPANNLFKLFFLYLDQSMVALYFFYSGYGIRESLKRKSGYADNFFKNRFLKTLLHFDLAVLLFVIAALFIKVDFFSHEPYTLKNYLLCWTGWESIGNSNWFMFVILSLYLISFVAMKIPRGWMTVKVLLPSILLWMVLYFTHTGKYWWYNTLLTFPLGMLYSQLKPDIDKAMRKPLLWAASFVGLALAYVGTHHLLGTDKFGIVSCLFCLLVVVFSMKVQVGNPVLRWLGVNAFAIYILQRLPMNVLSHLGVNRQIAVFVPVAIILTLLLAEGFTRATGILDRKLFQRV